MKQLIETDYIILENGKPIRFNGSKDIVIFGELQEAVDSIYTDYGQVVCPCMYAPKEVREELLSQINRD